MTEELSILSKLRELNPQLVPPGLSMDAWIGGAGPRFEGIRSRPAVEQSKDLRRILAIPRRPAVDLDGSAMALALIEYMQKILFLGPKDCVCQSAYHRPCITRLKASQAWALFEASLVQGLLGALSVGSGKTILNILLPMVVRDCKHAVILIPPGLRQQLLAEFRMLREHYKVPHLMLDGVHHKSNQPPGGPVLHVVPYSKFNRPESTAILGELNPDLIIADECHKIRNLTTATTSRVMRRFLEKKETRFCGYSGTITAKSIRDYAHIAAIALRENSPLPLDPSTVEEWAVALDPNPLPAPAGALMALCEPGETKVYEGFHRRLVETRGFVATTSGSIDASINIMQRVPPPMPDRLKELLKEVRANEERPDGEQLVDILQITKCVRELACGFFYRWKFPHGEPESLIKEWFSRRKAWGKELREQLKNRQEHMDSPKLCANAAKRAYQGEFGGEAYVGDLPVWYADTWKPWAEIKDKVYHEQDIIWLDRIKPEDRELYHKAYTPGADYLAKDAAEWGLKHRGVIWYEHRALGERISEISGLPRHGGGLGAEERILAEKGDRSIVASIKSHGTGRDGLQRLFNEQLITNPPSSGDIFEQVLGRLHRIGQEEDEVNTHVYRHVPEFAESIDKAICQAKYVAGTLGSNQKLLAATCDFPVDLSSVGL